MPYVPKRTVLVEFTVHSGGEILLMVNGPATGPPRKPPRKGRLSSYNPRRTAETNGFANGGFAQI
jgi:hypothetical protein